ATYRMVLAPVLGLDGHRLVRDLPSDKARKIIQEIGANRPALANLTKSILRRVFSFAIATGQRRDNPDRAGDHAQKPHEADCCRSRGRWASARMCRPRAS